MKKTLQLMAAWLVVACLLFTSASAQGGPGGQPQGGGQMKGGGQAGQPQGDTQQSGGQQQGGGQPQSGDQPQGGGQMGGGMNVDTDSITTAIATLDDEDTAASLTALLEAYETAASGTDSDATQEALKALMDAMADAGLQGSSQPQGNGEPQGGGMNVDTDSITTAIATLDDEDTAASLTALLEAYETAASGTDSDATQEALKALMDAMADAGLQATGGPAQNGRMGDDYGRFLDTTKITAAIATLDDEDTAASLTALLEAYETAASGTDSDATQEALKALLDAMADAQLQVDDQHKQPFSDAGKGKYLDTDAVADVIAALDDEDTAASLTALLEAYVEAASGTDSDATQTAFTALMDALRDAGIQG